MGWGLLFGVLAFTFSASAAIADKHSCSSYLAWLGLEEKLHAAQAQAAAADLAPQGRNYWNNEIASLRAEIAAAKRALLEEAAGGSADRVKPGSSNTVLAANSEPLAVFTSTRPQGTVRGARITRLSDDGERMLVIPEHGKTVYLWNLPKNEYWQLAMEDTVWDAAFDWNGNVLVLDDRGKLALFGANGKKLSTPLPAERTHQIAFANEKLLRISEELHLTPQFNYSVEKQHTVVLPHANRAEFLAISSDGRLAAVSINNDVALINLGDGALLKKLPDFTDRSLVCLQFVANSHRLVGLSDRGEIAVWDPKEMAAVTRFQMEAIAATSLALDTNGHAYVGGQFGGLYGVLAIVDLVTGEEKGRYEPGHYNGVGSVALSFDGTMLVTTSAKDGEIHFHHNPVASH